MARTPEAITPSSWRKVIAIATLASVIVSIVILAFTWPTKAMETNLPVSIAGPEAAVSQFEQGLKDRGIETFEFKQASSREDAERQIKERAHNLSERGVEALRQYAVRADAKL
ncbi:MAG: hypothetical protein ACFNL3_05605, partial [Rothia aeria]